ncbi:MAG TPA: ABC transporter permease [Cyclobacteriaceae bacterium]|nr:ABC transporter permease [Cyclobacteriaceae bacterium]
MFQNYFKVALRNILKHKFYSALNISGLALGLTACFIIGLYVIDELSFDQFHEDHDNLYSVALHGIIAEQEIYTSNSSPPVGPAMAAGIPGVEAMVRINTYSAMVMKYEDKAFTEMKAMDVDSNFFQFFSFKLLKGDPKEVLKEVNTMVITPEIATKYFGNEDPIGKIVTVDNDNRAVKITGVVEKCPSNSSIQYEILMSNIGDEFMKSTSWTNNGIFTYIRKNPNTTVESINMKLEEFVNKMVGPELQGAFGISFEDFKKNGGVYSYYIFPTERTHLFATELQDSMTPRSDIKYVYILGAVGVFILVIACINFMNLSTARSASRAKEVGLRKTLGSERSKLIFQFLAESFIYTLAGTVIAIVAVYLLIPSFQLLSGKAIGFGAMLQPVMIMGVVGIFVLVSFMAGSYPAFYLTSFKPVDVLKGKVKAGMRSKGIRSALVVVQFTISITLIISTMIVYNQLSYMQERSIGMDKQNVIILRNTSRLGNSREGFKQSVESQAGIVGSSYTNNVFPGVNNTTVFRMAGSQQDHILGTYFTDYDQAKTLKFEIVQGEFFTRGHIADSSVCLINEAAIKEFGWEGDVLKKKITSYNGERPHDMEVIGVVKDFNFESLKVKVRPLIVQFSKQSNNLVIRYDGSASAAIDKVRDEWKRIAPNDPFEYSFLDERFDELFREEQRLGQVFTVLTGIAIFVACLGLLGLASFTAEQRTKEIGIRKVMGATVSSVSTLLSREFMILVAIAFVVASALAWYVMDNWLSSFAYRIPMDASAFIIGGVLSGAIAWLTVSYHFVRAARSNPADSLRYE